MKLLPTQGNATTKQQPTKQPTYLCFIICILHTHRRKYSIFYLTNMQKHAIYLDIASLEMDTGSPTPCHLQLLRVDGHDASASACGLLLCGNLPINIRLIFKYLCLLLVFLLLFTCCLTGCC